MRREWKLSTLVRPILLAAVVPLAAPAEGSLVRYDFRGRFTEQTLDGPDGLGKEFTGTLIYDEAIPLGDPLENAWGGRERPYVSGAHRAGDPAPDGTMLRLWVDGKAVGSGSTGLSGGLFSSAGGSELVFHGEARDGDGYAPPEGVSISFKVDPSLLASGRFPDGLTVGDLLEARVTLRSVVVGKPWGELIGGSHLGGEVESFAIVPVPEPAWTVAALLAAAAWAARRRRGR